MRAFSLSTLRLSRSKASQQPTFEHQPLPMPHQTNSTQLVRDSSRYGAYAWWLEDPPRGRSRNRRPLGDNALDSPDMGASRCPMPNDDPARFPLADKHVLPACGPPTQRQPYPNHNLRYLSVRLNVLALRQRQGVPVFALEPPSPWDDDLEVDSTFNQSIQPVPMLINGRVRSVAPHTLLFDPATQQQQEQEPVLNGIHDQTAVKVHPDSRPESAAEVDADRHLFTTDNTRHLFVGLEDLVQRQQDGVPLRQAFSTASGHMLASLYAPGELDARERAIGLSHSNRAEGHGAIDLQGEVQYDGVDDDLEMCVDELDLQLSHLFLPLHDTESRFGSSNYSSTSTLVDDFADTAESISNHSDTDNREFGSFASGSTAVAPVTPEEGKDGEDLKELMLTALETLRRLQAEDASNHVGKRKRTSSRRAFSRAATAMRND